MTALWILLAWFLLSIPVGLLAARMIGRTADLSEFLANPKDDDQ